MGLFIPELTADITASAGAALEVKGAFNLQGGKGVTAIGVEDNKIKLLGRDVFNWNQGASQKVWGEVGMDFAPNASTGFKNTSGAENTQSSKTVVFGFITDEHSKNLSNGRISSQINIEFGGAIGLGLIAEWGIKIPIWKSDN
ncbi:hypothetical protein [Filimonas effusa]|uniref:Uncharacterized protein n=1 Tax=Filimonas effusa TaxID=2508721 RepID=A0A4Q1D027_9BACT|nr:hypothetical protein [Filimonas effusa]RXK80531.1 hypothetical protein ESB13_23130 [Filimonas effusa]